jgi:putative transcriptional regulator
MLDYKYFLKRVREGLMFSDKTYENGFDARKLPKFSDMVAGGDGANCLKTSYILVAETGKLSMSLSLMATIKIFLFKKV